LKLELAEGYRRLGHVQGSTFSENIGDVEGAIASFQKAARVGEDVLARDPRAVAAAILLTGAYDDLTNAMSNRGDSDAAEQAWRRHRAIVEQLERTSPNNPVVQASLASSYSNLAHFSGQRGDWPEAKALYTKSINLYEALRRAPEPSEDANRMRSHAFALKRLGGILVREGNLEDGERRYRTALALDEQVTGRYPDNATYRYDMTFSLTDLGLVAKRRGDFAQAESLWTRALAIRQAALAADPRNTRPKAGVANIHAYLGGLYVAQKRINEALSHCRETFAFGTR
jgi:serine/threonine-protein kinase